jgi:glycosyltransferase involved in cell wall biosynthesis
MKLSLVIPCYNEAANLPPLIARCAELSRAGNVEVLLVNNGSTDDSAEVMGRLLPAHPGLRSVHVEKNQGYGFGILSGLRAAQGDVLAWTHADMQTDPMDALKGFELFQRQGNNCFVKGKRYGRPFADVLFTVGMSCFETALLQAPMWDINAQPTMFTRSFFQTWSDDAPHDFSLDLYAYFMARRAGLAVHRFPVLFGKRLHGTSHWNVNWAAKRKFIKRTVDFSLEMKRKVRAS